jgi:hypothetical protein
VHLHGGRHGRLLAAMLLLRRTESSAGAAARRRSASMRPARARRIRDGGACVCTVTARVPRAPRAAAAALGIFLHTVAESVLFNHGIQFYGFRVRSDCMQNVSTAATLLYCKFGIILNSQI